MPTGPYDGCCRGPQASVRATDSRRRNGDRLGGSCILGLSDTKRTAINQSADVLAQVVAGRAAAFGFQFLDGRTAFTGHEICAARPFWLNSVNLSAIDESYHPTSNGQNLGYFAALRSITG